MPSRPVIVIGAGPAGCAVGSLLAAWGHRVLVIDRRSADRRALAESIPPSTDKLLAEIGALDLVRGARFVSWRGNTVWWGSDPARVETFPSGSAGYQVERGRFDRLLRAHAAASGAEFREGTVRRVERRAADVDRDPDDRLPAVTVETPDATDRIVGAFVLDCSGRAGVVARAGLRRESPLRTIALVGVWRRAAWPVPDNTHTLVASYPGGWAWSVPVDSQVRYVTLMVDPRRSDLARGRSSRDVYLDELAKVAPFRAVLQAATLDAAPSGADASIYDAQRCVDRDVLLVGDAASFIDPLSSFGVKKALASGWLAAIAVNTALRHPERRDAALEFFDRREREVFASARQQAAEFAAGAAASTPQPFWLARSEATIHPETGHEIDGTALRRDAGVQSAFLDLKQRVTIALCEDPAVPLAPRPLVRDHEIVLDDHLLLPDAPGGLRYLRGIDLVSLRRLAPRHSDVGELCASVAREQPGAALPDILGALSFLIARGALRHSA